MKKFKGFTDSETFTQVPDTILSSITESRLMTRTELKVTLYFLWRVEHMDGPFRALSEIGFQHERIWGFLRMRSVRGWKKL